MLIYLKNIIHIYIFNIKKIFNLLYLLQLKLNFQKQNKGLHYSCKTSLDNTAWMSITLFLK